MKSIRKKSEKQRAKVAKYQEVLEELRSHMGNGNSLEITYARKIMAERKVNQALCWAAVKVGVFSQFKLDGTVHYGLNFWSYEENEVAERVVEYLDKVYQANKDRKALEALKSGKGQNAQQKDKAGSSENPDPVSLLDEKDQKDKMATLFDQMDPVGQTSSPKVFPWTIGIRPTSDVDQLGLTRLEVERHYSLDLVEDIAALGAKYHSDPAKLNKALAILAVLHSGGEYFEKVQKILQLCQA